MLSPPTTPLLCKPTNLEVRNLSSTRTVVVAVAVAIRTHLATGGVGAALALAAATSVFAMDFIILFDGSAFMLFTYPVATREQ